MLNLENEKMPSRKWWKQARSEIEAEKKFIKSGRIGGNPLGLPNDTLIKDIKDMKLCSCSFNKKMRAKSNNRARK